VRRITFGELEKIGEEMVVADFKVVSWYWSGGNEEYHDTPRSRWSVSRPRYESGMSRIQVRSITACDVTDLPVEIMCRT
jgi:hypothetical protein